MPEVLYFFIKNILSIFKEKNKAVIEVKYGHLLNHL